MLKTDVEVELAGPSSRAELLKRLREAVARPSFIHAAWLEGADARAQADEFSDVDLWLDVEPGHENATLALVRQVVESFGPLSVEDKPAHPHPQIRQKFLGSVGLPVFNFVDVCVQTHGRDVKFTASDPYLVWLDRAKVIQNAETSEVDVQAELGRLWARRWRAVLVEKELRRGHTLEALNYYRNEVLPLLVRFLRLRHSPQKFDYGLKHIEHDLPSEATSRLLHLHRLTAPDELRQGIQVAQAWIEEIADDLRRSPS